MHIVSSCQICCTLNVAKDNSISDGYLEKYSEAEFRLSRRKYRDQLVMCAGIKDQGGSNCAHDLSTWPKLPEVFLGQFSIPSRQSRSPIVWACWMPQPALH